jgi:hypothetical protein
VTLAAKTEQALFELRTKLQSKGVTVHSFEEPDFWHELTAISVGPNDIAYRHLSSFPLAGGKS